jgi:hypothetical protein
MTTKLSNIAALALTAAFLATAPAARADEAQVKSLTFAYMDTKVRDWLEQADLLAAVRAANVANAALSQDDIDALDARWRDGDQTLIAPVLGGVASVALRKLCEGSRGIVTEMILMDNKGLNVGQCGPSSDYWQGDEAKYQKTFPMGPDTIFLDEIELDESSGHEQLQANITVTDPDTGDAIGALTVGIDAGFLLEQ